MLSRGLGLSQGQSHTAAKAQGVGQVVLPGQLVRAVIPSSASVH